MSNPTPEQVKVPTLLQEDQLILDNAFPTLLALRDNKRVISGLIPADANIFPGKYVSLSPYYMNRGDPPELGMWEIAVEDTVQARLQTAPNLSSGVTYSMTVKGEDNAVRTATQEEAHQLVMLVDILHKNCSAHIEITQIANRGRRHPFVHFGQLLIAKTKGLTPPEKR
jgi:hypothetical protein